MTLADAVEAVLRADDAGYVPFVDALRTFYQSDQTVDQHREVVAERIAELLDIERSFAVEVYRRVPRTLGMARS